jgi:serine/threonine-protein kinase
MSAGAGRWRELEPLLDELLDAAEPARRERLEALRSSDPALAAELERLLAADAGDRSALDLDAASLLSLVDDGGGDREASDGDPSLPVVAGYEVHERVGAGGSAEVFRAREADGGEVALKLLRPELADGELERRFERERGLLAALVHPGIARLLDFGVAADGRPFLVLEWVAGEDLAPWCDGRPLADRLARVAEVAAVLAFAHARGIAHRDVKASNVRVGADGRARLLDFGLAKLFAGDDAEPRATRSGVWLFTPDAAAPEQILGKRPGTAADVWGLGSLLFEVATGRRPFVRSGRPLSAVIAGLRKERPPRGAIGDRSLDRLVADCLVFDPADRPVATDVAAALEHWLERHRAGEPQRGAPRWRSKNSVMRRR